MPNPNDRNIMVEDARIVFRNFAGAERMYNPAGRRNFGLLLDPELADQLHHDGWAVKQLKPREEGDEPQAYLQVAVSFKGRPPTIVLISSRGRTTLGEDECAILDWVDIANVDLIVRPYEWEVNNKSGIKAYLKSIYVTIHEDALQLKYRDVPEIGAPEVPAIEAGPQYDFEGEVVE
jgi:hypothetical protein